MIHLQFTPIERHQARRLWLASCAVSVVLTLLTACSGSSEAQLMASAKLLADKGDSSGAAIQLKTLLQKSPSNAEARLLLGSALLARGDPKGAEVELRKAKELLVSDDRVSPILARALLAQQLNRQVTDEFGTRTLNDAKGAAELNTTVALALGRLGQVADAKSRLQGVLDRNPNFGPALVAMSRIVAGTGDMDGALVRLNSALAADPKDTDALMLKAEILADGRRDIEAARTTFRQGLVVDPNSVALHSARISAEIRQGANNQAKPALVEMQKALPNHPQTKYMAAVVAYNEQDFKTAKELTDALEKMAPNDVRVLQLAGAVSLRLNDLTQAESRLANAFRVNASSSYTRLLLAQTYLKLGQNQKALDIVAPTLQAAPPDPKSLALAAEAYIRLGDIAKGDELFTKALKLQPNNPNLRVAMAVTDLLKGQTDVGFGKLEKIAEEDATSTIADMAKISARMRTGPASELLKDIERLEKKEPNKPLAHDLRARALLRSNDRVGAKRSFERALEVDPMYFPSAAGLAALDRNEGDFKAAMARFTPILKAAPKHLQARMAELELARASGADSAVLEQLMKAAASDMPGELEPRLALAEFHLIAGAMEPALSVAQAAVAAFPNNLAALDVLGRCQIARGDLGQASVTFKQMMAIDRGAVLPYQRMAEVNARQNDPAEAVRNLRRAIALAPGQEVLVAELYGVALKGRQFDAARGVAKDLQKVGATAAAGLMLEGDVEAYQKNWVGAIEWYRKSLAKEPKASKVAVKIYMAQVANQRLPEASATMDSWLKSNPKDTGFRLFLADQALAKGEFPAAESRYREVVALAPNDANALNNIAWLMVRQNKPGATALAERAVALQPGSPPFIDTLALALAKDGKLTQALEVQGKLVARAPEVPVFRLTLAKIQIQAGQKAQARAELVKLDKLGAKFPEVKEVQRLLAETSG